jgi:MFS family permease
LRETIQRYLQVGRHRAFRRFWLGMMISRAGDAFTAVALSWVVLGIAGPAQLGIVLACFGLPRVVSGPVAGRVLDRRNPRLLLAADNAARGILIAIVAVLLWLHHLVVTELYAIAAASALCSALTEVAEASHRQPRCGICPGAGRGQLCGHVRALPAPARVPPGPHR